MRALQFTEFGPVSTLRLLELPDPKADAKSALVKVAAGSISPSDVKNVEGKMEHTTLPRVPGRDYAGTVVQGPAEWIGAQVWGTGGEIGYSIDGSHAELIAVPIASLRHKPRTLSMEQAAAVGVTYLAAWLGLVEYAQLAAGETLLVIGANGGVGSAAVQIGKWRGARVVGVDRHQLLPDSPVARAIDDFFVLEGQAFDSIVRGATNGRGAEVVFDTVGGPMFESALKSLGHFGRLLEISSSGDRRVSFDLIDFYHNESRLFGIDTRARDAIASAVLLEALAPFFQQSAFQPPVIDGVIALSDGRAAYEEVARGEVRGRLILAP
jgi:NADPH:quinone reductase